VAIRYDSFVKRPFEEHGFEDWQILDLQDCIQDINKFLPHVKIVNPDHGEMVFDPYEYQKVLLKKFQKNRFNVGLLARQSGKTTAVAVYALWYAIFQDDKVIGIVSNKEKVAKMILDRIKRMYERLPMWLKPGVKEYQKTGLTFDNGTQIMISATTEDAFRGQTINLLICDEFAFVPKNMAKDFWAANYPTISASKTSKVIVISTPNGMHNLFHKLWMRAERKENMFMTTKVTWTSVPGRDKEWAEAELKNLGSKQRFRQEHEVEFLGSASTVIDPDVLEQLLANYIEPILLDLEDHLYVYEKPKEGAEYVLGVDTAKGTGEHFSAIQILEIMNLKPIKFKQVGVYFNNTIDVYNFSEVVNKLSYYYNHAYIMCENNAEGAAIVNRLWWEYENENLINSGSKTIDLGIRATRKTKPIAVLLMKRLIEDGSLDLFDEETIDQLTSFVEESNKFFGKEMPDDLVSALYWATYIIEMGIFEGDYELRRHRKENQTEEDVWGILADVEDSVEDWSWLKDTKVMFGG